MSGNLNEGSVEQLRETIGGDVVLPGEAAYDPSRQAWNLAADQHPAAVVLAESADDVASTVLFATDNGLRVAPQGTGHGAGSLPDLGGTILLKLSRMGGAEVDPAAGTAHAGAGAQWRDVVGPAAEHGLAAMHGSAGTVGLVGYHAGGGHAWVGRSRGWACNSVRSFDVVTADGEQRTASAESEPDLFWALRGGGGSHAIVTGTEVELFELASAYAGGLLWDIERAAEIAAAWRDVTASAPEELASTLKLVRFPPFPDVPEPLRGRALVGVTFAFLGSAAEGGELLAPLRAVADPYLGQAGEVPAPALAEIAGDPVDPVPALAFGAPLAELGDDTLDAYVELAGPEADVPLIHLEIRHLGGALARGSASNGALDSLDSPYLLGAIGPVPVPEARAGVQATFEAIGERMAPWTAERGLLGFQEQEPGWRASFPAATADRLAELRDAYDPARLIVSNHDGD
ncbi:MAG: FAD-binding oxidoreductase [Solirubrobacterales bacterium]